MATITIEEGELTSIDNIAGSRTFTYDSNHKMLTDSDGGSFGWSHDAIETVSLGSESAAVAPQLVKGTGEFALTNDTFVSEFTDGEGNTTYGKLDELGRLLTVVQPWGADEGWVYNEDGLLESYIARHSRNRKGE